MEAMVGKVIEEAEASCDAVSSTTETESAAEPLPRTQPPVLGPIQSTSSSGVQDSVAFGILGQGEVETSAVRKEPIGPTTETKMGGSEGISLDTEKQQ